MDPKLLALIAIAVMAVLLAGWMAIRKQKMRRLQKVFGSEYDRAVREVGPRQVNSVLSQREKRVERFALRELSMAERERFLNEWRVVQSRFVDDPKSAASDASLLVDWLMLTRGYPMSDFEQRTADLSVRHPGMVDKYRAAHEIALRQRNGQVTTEDLRNVLLYYRFLFDELLQPAAGLKKEVA